jgi:hypothetical protein
VSIYVKLVMTTGSPRVLLILEYKTSYAITLTS